MVMKNPVSTTLPESYGEAFLAMFSSAGPKTLLAAVVLTCVARLSLGEVAIGDGLVFVSLILLRGFMEWALHMYIFNAAPLPLIGWRLRNPISIMHGQHHEDPGRLETLFFGWKGVLFVIAASFGLLLFVFRDARLAMSGLSAVAINLLMYEWCHIVAHSKIKPENHFFRQVIENHRNHHFVDGAMSMGVSSVLADKVLGTYRAS